MGNAEYMGGLGGSVAWAGGLTARGGNIGPRVGGKAAITSHWRMNSARHCVHRARSSTVPCKVLRSTVLCHEPPLPIYICASLLFVTCSHFSACVQCFESG